MIDQKVHGMHRFGGSPGFKDTKLALKKHKCFFSVEASCAAESYRDEVIKKTVEVWRRETIDTNINVCFFFFFSVLIIDLL